jgi:hypothetical protein
MEKPPVSGDSDGTTGLGRRALRPWPRASGEGNDRDEAATVASHAPARRCVMPQLSGWVVGLVTRNEEGYEEFGRWLGDNWYWVALGIVVFYVVSAIVQLVRRRHG